MSREEASAILLGLLKSELDSNTRQAIDIALDSIAAVDRLTKILDSYVGREK